MPDDQVAAAVLAAAIIRVRGKADPEDVKAALHEATEALFKQQATNHKQQRLDAAMHR